ncbi:protein phosphatase CheZ, partial [Escherichia coli]|uniref:protein phosphatase CheZ n=1 Tax=Escherichia coli TaxID=562 RepID=UPI00192A6CE9
AQHDYIAAETRRVVTSLVKDPVAAVAKGEIMNFLTDVERVTKEADTHLTEIMMAQDFHDLTGQVVAKVVTLANDLEDSLVKLLVQVVPPEQREKVDPTILQGPVVNHEGRTDVVANQGEVDDLLASLQRAAILTSEKFKAVRLTFEPGLLSIASSNAEQEEAKEAIEIDYAAHTIETGFNVTYLMDALAN